MATTMRIRLLVAVPLVWLVGVAPVMAARCSAYLVFYNLDRGIHGEVNKECSGGHTRIWGNWGVTSNYHGRVDGSQFEGWEYVDHKYQWNSCTKIRNPHLFNGPAGTFTQVDRGTTMPYAIVRRNGPDRRDCRQWLRGGVFTLLYQFMKLYELDPTPLRIIPFVGKDDYVTTLMYVKVNIPVTCTSRWSCSGLSGVISPSSGTRDVTAKIKVSVRLTRR